MDTTDQLHIGADNPSDDINPEAGGEPAGFEAVAREKGWRPKEEYEGEEGNWVDAEEFVKRQPLFDKIKTQSKKLKELERTVEALAKHYNESIGQAKQRMLDELKNERREAIELGEVTRVEAIDARMQEVSASTAPPKVGPVYDPEVEAFIEAQKDWFNKDQEMTTFAVAYNESYLQKHPGEMAKSLEQTLKAVKMAFPDKFSNPRRATPPAVEGSVPSGKTDSKYSYSRLTAEQKLVYNQLVKTHKQMSHDEYFKSLDEAGFLA